MLEDAEKGDYIGIYAGELYNNLVEENPAAQTKMYVFLDPQALTHKNV